MFIFSTEVAIDEAGTPRQIQNLESGYWLWIFSMLIILIGNSAQIYFSNSTKKRQLKARISLDLQSNNETLTDN